MAFKTKDFLYIDPIGASSRFIFDTKHNTSKPMTVTKGAMAGAAIGSVVPGLGTAVGAVIGGLVGGFTKIFGGPSVKQAHRQQIGSGVKLHDAAQKTFNEQVQSGQLRVLKAFPSWAFDPADPWMIYWLGQDKNQYGFAVPPAGYQPLNDRDPTKTGIFRWRGTGTSPVNIQLNKELAMQQVADAQAQKNAQIAAQQQAELLAQQAEANRQAVLLRQQQFQAEKEAKAAALVAAKQAAQESFDDALQSARSAARRGDFAAADSRISEANRYVPTIGYANASDLRATRFYIDDQRAKADAAARIASTIQTSPSANVAVSSPSVSALEQQLASAQAQSNAVTGSAVPTSTSVTSSYSSPAAPSGSSYASQGSVDNAWDNSFDVTGSFDGGLEGLAEISTGSTVDAVSSSQKLAKALFNASSKPPTAASAAESGSLKNIVGRITLMQALLGAGTIYFAYQAYKRG